MVAAPQNAAISNDIAGDPAPSVRKIFDDHGKFVSRTLICLGVPRPDVEDLLQEVFMVVHRRLADYEGRGSMRSWLYAISLRVVYGHRRRLARRRENVTDRPPDTVAPPVQEQRADSGLKRGLALEALDTLDEDHRQVFVLYEVEELSMAEIAECLGIPTKTAYSRLYAARKKLLSAVRRASNRRAG